MAKCTRCSKEVAPTARFCASCGAPAPEITRPGEPRIDVLPEVPVNPFAVTASPDSGVNPFGTTQRPDLPAAKSEPPPAPTPISPLASSAAQNERHAAQELLASAQAAAELAASRKKPGTQMMPNAPGRPALPAPAEAGDAPAPEKKKPPVARTVAMGNWNKPSSVPPAALAATAPAPPPAPSSPRLPASVAAPGSAFAPGSAMAPGSAFAPGSAVPPGSAYTPGSGLPGSAPGHAYPPHPPTPPAGPGGWGWQAPPRGYAFAPGARVSVTWSNGQRYPATVSQVSGTQCLVVFPDGQQHWVDAQYLTAG